MKLIELHLHSDNSIILLNIDFIVAIEPIPTGLNILMNGGENFRVAENQQELISLLGLVPSTLQLK